DVFGQPFGDRVALDLGDEAGRVLAIEKTVELAGCGVHLRMLRMLRMESASMRASSGTGHGRAISASVTPSSARRTMSLIERQFVRMPQASSMSQMPLVALHSVSPNGRSSSASTMSAMVIFSDGRDSE